jgi:diguanylate cyclase (GGDEF)-like protein
LIHALVSGCLAFCRTDGESEAQWHSIEDKILVTVPRLNDRGDLDYLANSLLIAFNILERSMLDSVSAVYLKEDAANDFVLRSTSCEDVSFSKTIPENVALKYAAEMNSSSDAATGNVQPEDIAHFTQDAPATRIRLHGLITDEELKGLLVVALGKDEEDEGKFIELAAEIIQINLDMEYQFNSINAENTFLSDLVNRAGSLDLSSTSEAIIDALTGLAKSVLTFDCLTISIQTPENKEGLRIEWTEGEGQDYSPGFDFKIANVLHSEVYRQGKAISIGNMPESDYHGRFEQGDFQKSELKSFLGIPIVEAGMARGTVAVESRARDHYSAKDLQLLGAIVRVYGTAICWLQRYQEAHKMATVDGLTQLLNHRSFLERFSEEVERAARYGGSITFLMLDLDHFKQVNDTYGHLHGDYVLWQISQLIRACIRKADIAGRYGGEEFGVIIINAGKQESFNTAERIRQTIADFKFKNNDIENRVSASIGMAEYPLDGHDVNTLILRADQAMYAVKRQGGNDVLSYHKELNNHKDKE